MEVIETGLPGVYIIEPKVFRDGRGYFYESWNKSVFDREVRPVDFVQDNESQSCYGVVRGLHYQKGEHAQSKLVRAVRGRVLDVAVDIRVGSPTFGRHVAVELSEDNKRQLFNPRGFAHGFSVLSETAVFQYKCDNLYCPSSEGAIAWNDPALGIDWRIPHEDIILYKHYTPEEYPRYINYDAINVNKTEEIPMDYDGAMGVPITFLDKYNPEQFEILGKSLDLADMSIIKQQLGKLNGGPRFYIEKEGVLTRLYERIVIRKIKKQ